MLLFVIIRLYMTYFEHDEHFFASTIAFACGMFMLGVLNIANKIIRNPFKQVRFPAHGKPQNQRRLTHAPFSRRRVTHSAEPCYMCTGLVLDCLVWFATIPTRTFTITSPLLVSSCWRLESGSAKKLMLKWCKIEISTVSLEKERHGSEISVQSPPISKPKKSDNFPSSFLKMLIWSYFRRYCAVSPLRGFYLELQNNLLAEADEKPNLTKTVWTQICLPYLSFELHRLQRCCSSTEVCCWIFPALTGQKRFRIASLSTYLHLSIIYEIYTAAQSSRSAGTVLYVQEELSETLQFSPHPLHIYELELSKILFYLISYPLKSM